jgi:hypothetical protein
MLPQFRVKLKRLKNLTLGAACFALDLGREPRVARRDTANAHFK